jgi:hypothetical protein
MKKVECNHAHCKCMNLDKQCTNFHYADCNKEYIEWERKQAIIGKEITVLKKDANSGEVIEKICFVNGDKIFYELEDNSN